MRLNSWRLAFRSENPVTFQWTPAAGLSCTDCPFPTLTFQSAGQYQLTATDALDLSQESAETKEMYGLNQEAYVMHRKWISPAREGPRQDCSSRDGRNGGDE